MSKYEIPERLYQGLTIDQFLEHWTAGAIRGLSKHHLDSGNGKKGTWLSNDLGYILEHRHGMEVIGESEVLADWSDLFKELGIKGDSQIRQQICKTRVIAELSRVPNPEKLVPHFLPGQLFYFGDIPRKHISAVYLDQYDNGRMEGDIGRLVTSGVPREIIKIHDRVKNSRY